MEYERIHKPLPSQSQGFSVSPRKLRSMLLGLEKRRKEEEEKAVVTEDENIESEDRRASAADSCRDVECSTSLSSNGGGGGAAAHRPRIRAQDDDSFDSDSGSSGFDFQKAGSAGPVQRFTTVAAKLPPFSKPAPSKWDDAEKWISSPNSNKTGNGRKNSNKPGLSGLVGRPPPANKVVVEVVPEEELAGDLKKTKKGGGAIKGVSWVDQSFSLVGLGGKGGIWADKLLPDAPKSNFNATPHSASVMEVKSVSMRDMGTEMTPIASQEPSRTATPAQPSTPNRSPVSSRTSIPPRTNASPVTAESGKELSEKEKTRREIMVLGRQLGKTNIAAWASREESGGNESCKNGTADRSGRSNIEIRAAGWEEAEKAKYLARFKREEVKIQAWENHQRAKIEAEMQKIEVEVEKIRAKSQDKLMNKLAASRHEADEKRAVAEAKRNKEAARTAQQADYIRRTGRVPSFSCWTWCL